MRAALIGTGRIARQHLSCLATLPGVEIAGVCDLSRAAAEAAAERYGAARSYTDHRAMLAEARPDVVHVTTPPASHVPLAGDALDAGAHVIVEKPVAIGGDAVEGLLERAEAVGRLVIENYNYLFNPPVLALRERLGSGEAGELTHAEVSLALDVLGEGGMFADRNLRNPVLDLPGGAVADFVTHLASLAHAFVGAHRAVAVAWPADREETAVAGTEMRALVEGERGTATLLFSARAQPDAFQVRVDATRMRMSASLFEPRVSADRLRPLPKPLVPVLNGLEEARTAARAAIGGLWGKLGGGPGAYSGLWELLGRAYRAFATGELPPVTHAQVREVNRLVGALVDERNRV